MSRNPLQLTPAPLTEAERRHYRDQLRTARYAALADAEGFGAICFALEELGLRLRGREAQLGDYEPRIAQLAQQSSALHDLAQRMPSQFKSFAALYETVRRARNDAMHIGAYARHATEAAIELCIDLEDGLMANVKRTVGSVMVRSPIGVESWQPVARARQLMLMHSFSFLPVCLDQGWLLVSELGLAKYLKGAERKNRLGLSIADAVKDGLELVPVDKASLLRANMSADDILEKAVVINGPMLWLVVDDQREDHLAGVLSPFELM